MSIKEAIWKIHVLHLFRSFFSPFHWYQKKTPRRSGDLHIREEHSCHVGSGRRVAEVNEAVLAQQWRVTWRRQQSDGETVLSNPIWV